MSSAIAVNSVRVLLPVREKLITGISLAWALATLGSLASLGSSDFAMSTCSRSS